MKYRVLAALSLVFFPSILVAEDSAPRSFLQSFREGEVHLSFRYRFETVDQDLIDDQANASTLRTSLSYETKPWKGFSFFIEAEDVKDIGTDGQYNDTTNGLRSRPIVADPENTELNQAFIRIERGRTRFEVGRQEIVLGDSRFVGNVGWRQVHQSFDGLTVESDVTDRLDLTYAYLENVNRIFGDNRQLDGHVLDLGIELPVGALHLYGILLDYSEIRDAGLSTSTLGVELKGTHPVDAWKFLWEAEYSQQSDVGDNPVDTSAGYLHAMAGAAHGWLTAKVGFETLEGSLDNGRFQTPLATLHKFNGWADKFLSTPAAGLEDLYLQIAGKHGSLAWAAHYHDFSAASTSIEYGNELNMQLTYKTRWAQTVGVKAAFYDADRHATDTEKVWLWTSYRF